MCPIINKRIQEKRKYESNKRDNLNTKAVYNTGTWRKLRLEYLSKNPLCKRCEAKGKINSAVEVHHVVEIDKGRTLSEKQTLGFDLNNLEGLCSKCHIEHHKIKRGLKQV